MKQQTRLGLILILGGALAMAQGPGPGDGPPPGAPRPPEAPPAPRAHRPPMEHAMHAAPGRWWHNPEMSQKLGLSADQQKKMDDVFQQYRLKLIDLSASLQKEEAVLEPLMEAPQGDEAKTVAQIDRVAQARAELEKANAKMLLGVRRVLTQDQWKKLQVQGGPERGPRPSQLPQPPQQPQQPQPPQPPQPRRND